MLIGKGMICHTKHIDTILIFQIAMCSVLHEVALILKGWQQYYLSMAKQNNSCPFLRSRIVWIENAVILLNIQQLYNLLQRFHQHVPAILTHNFLQFCDGMRIIQSTISLLNIHHTNPTHVNILASLMAPGWTTTYTPRGGRDHPDFPVPVSELLQLHPSLRPSETWKRGFWRLC